MRWEGNNNQILRKGRRNNEKRKIISLRNWVFEEFFLTFFSPSLEKNVIKKLRRKMSGERVRKYLRMFKIQVRWRGLFGNEFMINDRDDEVNYYKIFN